MESLFMPVISMFYGIIIYLYFFDEERHPFRIDPLK